VSRPIADYALLGDCHSGALVSTDGSIDWWCAPRFDSRSVFARLLDSDAGHFAIRPVADFTVRREYVPDTMVLRTTFRTASGTLCVTDALALETGARGHDLGLRSPHILLRVAEVLSGRVELLVEFAPRPEYGLVFPALRRVRGGVRTVGGADTLLLTSYLDLKVDGATAGMRVTLEECERTAFALQHQGGMARTDFDAVDPASMLEDTVAGWRSWAAEHRGYDGPYREEVNRSALVLQALTYQPSGAVVAAPTTSLPDKSKPEVVVVTGASAAVGRAIAHAFGKRGAHVALLARGEDGLNGATQEVESFGGRALAIPTDVSDHEAVEAAAVRVEAELGPIDIWVNGAMATVFARVVDTTPEEFKRATEVTYLGAVYGTMAALKRMVARDRGKIVQVGSALSYRAIPLQAAYCGAKFGIRGFTGSIRTELLADKSKVQITMCSCPA